MERLHKVSTPGAVAIRPGAPEMKAVEVSAYAVKSLQALRFGCACVAPRFKPAECTSLEHGPASEPVKAPEVTRVLLDAGAAAESKSLIARSRTRLNQAKLTYINKYTYTRN